MGLTVWKATAYNVGLELKGANPKLGFILGKVGDQRGDQEEDNQEKHWVTTIGVGLMDIVIYLSLEIVSHTYKESS